MSTRHTQRMEQRQAERFAVHDLVCDAGTLIDLSCDGACLHRHTFWPVGKVREVSIRSGEHQVCVGAECVRVEEIEPGLFRVGVRFPEVGPAERALLERLAAIHAGY